MKITDKELHAIESSNPDETVKRLIEHIRTMEDDYSDTSSDLVTLTDIAKLDGTSRQNIYSQSLGKTFPRPVATVGKSRVWRRKSIEEWLGTR